jgi:exodeoxyribonuclease V gamma subunit
LNDGAFPRPRQHLSFDLMARRPRLGDRSTREDDRYLFLETLLSARERLYLSYVGQSIRDNSVIPPSVLVSELLDYIERGFHAADGALPGGQVVTRHPLQPFSEQYFRPGGRLFSYSRDNCAASASARQLRQAPGAFCDAPLPEPPARLRHVTLEQLANFFGNPCQFFLSHRLGVRLAEGPEGLLEQEPFVLNALENHRIKHAWVGYSLSPSSTGSGRAGPTPFSNPPNEWLSAAGELPLGQVGQAEYRRLDVTVERFLEQLQTRRADPSRGAVDLDFQLGEFHLSGRLPAFTNAGPLYFRCAKTKAKDLLRAWTLHLAANLVEPGSFTTLIAEDGCRHYTPPADARGLLTDLLEAYWQGLHAPLKFFPETAFAFAEAKRKPGEGLAPDEEALEVARKIWEGSERWAPAEQANPAIALCFRDSEPLDEEFIGLTQRIMGPILYHEVKELP